MHTQASFLEVVDIDGKSDAIIAGSIEMSTSTVLSVVIGITEDKPSLVQVMTVFIAIRNINSAQSISSFWILYKWKSSIHCVDFLFIYTILPNPGACGVNCGWILQPNISLDLYSVNYRSRFLPFSLLFELLCWQAEQNISNHYNVEFMWESCGSFRRHSQFFHSKFKKRLNCWNVFAHNFSLHIQQFWHQPFVV